jgi:hypothetical protein
MVPRNDDILDNQLEEAANQNLQRDAWMQAPSSLDVDYVQPRKKVDKSTFVRATEASGPQLARQPVDDKRPSDDSAEREVDYTFGDSGSQWRMTKLRAVYRTAKETGRSVEDVALERYGDLRYFDDAREEEIEVDRRQTYGKGYLGKEKPSGDLYEERKLKAGIHRTAPSHGFSTPPQGQVLQDPRPTTHTVPLDRSALNKLAAELLKAKMKSAPNVAELQEKYDAAVAASANRTEPDVVVLGAMDNRLLAGGRQGEVKALTNKRGRERGLVVENEDMTIEDMVRQERRTRGQAGGEGLLLAERIAKDGKFNVSLLNNKYVGHVLTIRSRTTWTTWMRMPTD